MSAITPAEYKLIAEDLAAGYALIRDAMNDGTASGTAYVESNEAADNVFGSTDTNSVTESIDPAGSIAVDLGTVYSAITTKFTVANAKVLATTYFSPALRSLNSHILNRADEGDHSTIGAYYTYNSATLFSGSYFSTDFEELSAQIGITIDTDWVTS